MAIGVRPGMLLDGKYEVLTLLGAGGMGEVFKARHVHLNAFRCIKIMRANLLADDSYRMRFLREARLATQIHHPNIAVVHDFEIVEDGSCYMVTEFIDGITVRQWSAEHGRFPLPLAAEVGVQVLAGLDHIHRRGLLHRDISADNVMLSYDDEDRLVIKIIDLGVAKDVGAGPTDTTQTGMLVGNPKYMSPEQLGELEEGQQLDARADLYCFGIVLYEMIAGVAPFTSKTPTGYIIKHLTEKPPSLREVHPDVLWPETIEAIVLRALEKRREHRYPDARSFSSALSAFLARPAGTYTRGEVDSLSSPKPRAEAHELATEVVSSDVKPLTAADAFQHAWEEGSAAAWQRFLSRHADATLAMRARQLLAEAEEFERVAREASESGLRDFLKTWPEGRHRLDAEVRLLDIKKRREDEEWQKVVAADSFTAVQQFVIRYPSGLHAADAERFSDERVAFETAAALDTEQSWDEYLEKFGEDRHAELARARRVAAREREDAAFNAALATNTADAWQEFLDRFPSGERSVRAESLRRAAAADEMAWFRANDDGSLAAMQAYVHAHPQGRWLDEAKQRIVALREAVAANEPRDFERAWEAGTASAWDDYLAAHDDSPRLDDARRCREEAAEFELARAANIVALWRAFIKAWPEGRHRLDAELWLQQIRK